MAVSSLQKTCGDTKKVLPIAYMGTITAKQLHQETKSILDQLELGEPLIITRNGRAVGRLEPLSPKQPPKWDDIMGEVWQAQKQIKPSERVPNPVLKERQRHRR